ncbi:MAG: hypothetical protein AB8H79_14795 [Myxococcota bacterium]
MRLILCTLCLLASAPALADGPWFGATPVDDDAIAEAPALSHEERVDLRTISGALEEGVRTVVVDGADPIEALPVAVAVAPETTAAELRGLLAGSGAQSVSLHGVQVRWILWNGTTSVRAFTATLLPSKATSFMALRAAELPSHPRKAVLPGGLGKNWDKLEKQLTQALRHNRCGALPVATDDALSTVVPTHFFEQAKVARDTAATQRIALCDGAAAATWDRLELRLDALHFNLFDADGVLRGGLRMNVEGETGTFAYPLFKKIQP